MSTPNVSFTELETAAKPATTTESQATPAVTEQTTTAAAPVQPQFTEQDAQTLRTFADAGISISNYKDLLTAKQLVENLPKIIRTNPRVLTAEIAKNDPEAYNTLLDAISDEWYEVKGKKLEQSAQGGASSTTSSNADPRVEALTAKIENLISERNQEKSQRQQDQILSGYNSTVEGLLAKLPEGVPEQAKDYIRLKTNELLWKDNSARERIGKGVYVDVPKYFAEASAKATADTKASADKEHSRRADVESRGTREITPAAENVNGSQEQIAPGQDPIWNDAGLAKDTAAALRASR